MSGRVWRETTVWVAHEPCDRCDYMAEVRWENGQGHGAVICTKCGKYTRVEDDGPPFIMRPDSAPHDSETISADTPDTEDGAHE